MTTDDGTTLAQRFAAWLAPALRAAGYDIDRQRGGGRTELAERVGVSPSTVNRWLGGQAVPEPAKFEAIANAVGVDPTKMLIDTGIISAKALTAGTQSDVRLRPISPAEAADELGITNARDRALFIAMVNQLERSTRTPADQDEEGHGGAAAER